MDVFLLEKAREVGALQAEQLGRFRLVPVTAALILFNFQGKEFTCAITKPSQKTAEGPEATPTL